MVNATMWVTDLVTELEYRPPVARTPPIMASLSPSGMSAQHSTRPEKYKRGSGLYDRGLASRPLATEAVTHSGLTTDFKASVAASYSTKSGVAEMICVISLRDILPLGPGRLCSCAPLSISSLVSYVDSLAQGLGQAHNTYSFCIGQFE